MRPYELLVMPQQGLVNAGYNSHDSVSGEGCSLNIKPSRVVVGFGQPVSVSCEATRPVRVLGWESSISAAHTQQDLSVQWTVGSLIDWIEEPICYGVFFTAPRQCEEKLNLVLYSESRPAFTQRITHTKLSKCHKMCMFPQKHLIASRSGP